MVVKANEIASSGYVVHTLEASLWCRSLRGSFEDAVLTAVNLGNDTDTTRCIAAGSTGLVFPLAVKKFNWKQLIDYSAGVN